MLLLFDEGGAQSVTGPMTEAPPGHYEGNYTLPYGASLASAMLVLHLEDGRGNSGSTVLPARLLPA